MIRRTALASLSALALSCGGEPPPVATAPEPVVVAKIDVAPVRAADAPPELELKLTPRKGDDGEVAKIDVALAYTGLDESQPFGVYMPDQQDGGEAGIAAAVEAVSATDDDGPLALTREKARIDDDDCFAWRASRPPRGVVRLAYAVRTPKATLEHFEDLRAVAGGVQGVTRNVLLQPEPLDKRVYDVRTTWDVSELGPNAEAISTLNPGPLTLRRLRNTAFMAGPMGRARFGDGPAFVEGAWMGKTAFDARQAVEFASRARAYQREFFRDPADTRFTVIIRSIPGELPGWVGTGREGGFLFIPSTALPWGRKARYVLSHEVAHRWIGQNDTGVRFEGKDGTAFWFTEGFTVFTALELALRAGLVPPDEFIAEVDDRAARLYRNALQGASNDDIAARFATVGEIQTVPYDRGMLYEIELDAAIRARSHGARSADDLLLVLMDKARAKAKAKGAGVATVPLVIDDFRDAVRAELGDEGIARYEAVIVRGEVPKPPLDALGPCFKGKELRTATWVPGFDIASFGRKKVSGLVAGSAAARAGLRDGDVIQKGSVVDNIHPEKRVKMKVERDGKTITVEFSPAGAHGTGVSWEFDPKAAQPCALAKK